MPVLRARVLTPLSPTEVRWIDDALVSIDGTGRIADVRPPDGRAVDLDLRPGVLTPGFVDGHLHYPQTRIVGAANGPLLQWLQEATFPEEARFADPDHAEQVAEVFCRCLAAAGTTLSMVYGSAHARAADALFEALDRSGLRAIAGPVLMDDNCPEELQVPAAQALPALERLVDRWHGHDGRLQVAVIPRFALSCTPELLQAAGRLAREHELWVTTHLAEHEDEVAQVKARFEVPDYLRAYEDAALVHDRAVFAHCIHLTGSEWERVQQAGSVVAHCPDSNFFLGSGHLPTHQVLERGIPVTVGSDIAAGRTFRIPRVLSAAHDNGLTQGVRLEPAHLLWWGTRGGALALSEPRVGAIEPGLDADLVLHQVPEWVVSSDMAMAWLLFDSDAPRPLKTWVRGRLVWDREHGGFPWQ